MGFRDLHTFNMAILAKQCWRLMEKPDSLCSRVLRAKYYPEGNLLKTKLKPGSSFTWQSVMAGLENFKRGCIWRVGDATQINVWEDCWIPSSPTRMMATPQGNLVVSKVAELTNPGTGIWDE
jgi:hypothetical protein